MMRISSAHPSKYLKASDLQERQITVTMSHVTMEKIGMDTEEKKPVLYFEGKSKGLVLNMTNSKTISMVYGDETEDWLGKPITLYPAQVQYKSDMVEAVRVKVPKANMPANVRPTPEPPPPTSPDEYGAEMNDEIPF